MAVQTHAGGRQGAAGEDGSSSDRWYARSPEEVATAFGVDPATGLPAARAARLLASHGPNALPEEKPKSEWQRFLAEYRTFMQIILVAAGVVSLVIAEWSTAILLFVLTVLNALIGMREEGKLGIPGEAILGADFAALPESERLERIDKIGVVGRVAPEHKVMLADTLKKKGEVVAMTGDGVNDAPAIKAADIGIAMGTGTEVAKDAGRMILSDDNFATIVFAVEQGRKLYDNLMKYVRFIMITLVAFVGTFLGASLLNIAAGQPFTPVQILWINFLIDTPLGIALGFDRETPGLMRREPRPREDSILKAPMLLTSLLTGLFMAVCLLGLIAYGANVDHHAVVGVTLAMSAFAWCRIVCTYESRSLKGSALTVSSFECRQINLIAIGEVVLAFLVTEWDLLNRLLGTTHITLSERMLSWAPAVILLLLWELGKLIARRVSHQGSQPAVTTAAQAAAALPIRACDDYLQR